MILLGEFFGLIHIEKSQVFLLKDTILWMSIFFFIIEYLHIYRDEEVIVQAVVQVHMQRGIR
jgi:hypothetical protein